MAIQVLYLEDDPHDAELVVRELTKAGLDFRLTVVTGRADFEAALERDPPDLIISDHNVPQFDGRAALAAVRRACPDVPFILFTGSLNEEAAVEYMKSGAADYVLKDRVARLGPAVREALERARERRELRGYEVFLKQIIEASPNPIFVRDAGGRFVLANRALAAAYGTTVERVIGQRLEEITSHAEEAAELQAQEREVLRSGEPLFIAEERVTNPVTGDQRWFQVVRVPLVAPGSGEPRVLSLATDLTERKRLEAELFQAQKMEALGQLASGIAHDFNNVLTTIVSNAELLLTELPPEDPRRQGLLDICDAAQRAGGLTRQLLAFSRKQALHPKVLDLNQLVEGLQRMLVRLLGETIEIELRLEPDLRRVRADPAQVEQILLNLAVNARDAMPGGGRITIETANAEAGRLVLLAVSDTGVGMDAETRARIFEPFFTTKGSGRGTGLGLFTVYGIVRQSGGQVAVNSQPGQGTTFRVYLPALAGEEAEANAQVEDRGMPRGSETILVVEDTEPLRLLAVRILRSLGYTVLDAANADEALRVAGGYARRIDLLLTDVVLPGLAGRDLGRRLAAVRPGLRVIYMSGYPDETPLQRDAPVEGVAFLEKPFTPGVLARKVREVLDRQVSGTA